MARIYGLYTEQMCWYVGSTVQTLNQRENEHRNVKYSKCSSIYIPNEYEWEIRLIEECSILNKRMREQCYYDLLKPLYNTRRPIQLTKEQRRDKLMRNKEQIKKQKQEYYQKNKKESQEYYQKNKEKISQRNKQKYERKKLENSKISEKICVE